MGGEQQGAPEKAAVDTTTVHCLTPDMLEKPACYCLNESKHHPHTNLFIGDDTLPLRSDADEQLLIHLQFQEFCKIKALKFLPHRNAEEEETAPTIIKIFVNRVNIGFSDAADVIPTEEIDLSSAPLDPEGKILVNFVKYQRVSSLTIFVEENMGADVTVIGGLKVFGMSVQGTNVNDIKKAG